MRPSAPRSSRISSTVARYWRASPPGALVVGMTVVDLLHVDAQGVGVVPVGLGDAGEAAAQADHGGDGLARRGVAVLDHFGDDTDPLELAVAAGEQEYVIFVADVDLQVGGDGGEDDCVIKGYEEVCHELSPVSVVSLEKHSAY